MSQSSDQGTGDSKIGNLKASVRAFLGDVDAAKPLDGTDSNSKDPTPDLRSEQLLNKLKTFKIDSLVKGSELQAIVAKRAKLSNAVKALNDNTADSLASTVDDLGTRIEIANEHFRLHAKINAGIDLALKEYKEARSEFSANQLSRFTEDLKDLQGKLATTKDGAELKLLGQRAEVMRRTMEQAKEFSRHHDEWRKEKLVIVTYGTKGLDPTTIEKAKKAYEHTDRKSMEAAEQGDFKTAEAAESAFDKVISDLKLDEAAIYAKCLLEFQSNEMRAFEKMLKSGIEDSVDWQKDYDSLKLLAAQGNIAGAIRALGDLAMFVRAMQPSFETWLQYSNLFEKNIATVDHAEAQMKMAVKARDPKAAAAAWKDINKLALTPANDAVEYGALTENEKEACVSVRIEKLRTEKNAAGEACKNVLSGGIGRAEDKMKVKKDSMSERAGKAHAEMDAALLYVADAKKLDEFLAKIGPILDSDIILRDAINLNASPISLKAIKDLKKAANCKKNLSSMVLFARDLLKSLSDMSRYYEVLKLLEMLLPALDRLKQQQDACKKAMGEAALQIQAKEFLEATRILQAFLDDGGYEALLADLADFGKLKESSDKLTKKALSHIARLPAPAKDKLKAVVEDSLERALEPSQAKQDYAASIQFLEEHVALLDEVRPLANLITSAEMIARGLRRGAVTDPVPNFDAEFSKVLDKAQTDMKTARGWVEKLISSMSDEVNAAAKLLEKADSENSGAGHSQARHGAALHSNDDMLKARVESGFVQDDTEPHLTFDASAFKNNADWLAGREMGIEQAEQRGMKFSDQILLPPAADYYEETIDFGREIDKAILGMKQKVVADDDGTVKKAKMFESYVLTEGLSKVRVSFLFQYDKPDDNKKNVENRTEYEKRFDANPKKNGTPKPYSGRWVMMQQFPMTDGWDPETRSYKE